MRKRFPANVLSENGFELLNRFLTYDPKKRVNASEAMKHQYFKVSSAPRGEESELLVLRDIESVCGMVRCVCGCVLGGMVRCVDVLSATVVVCY